MTTPPLILPDPRNQVGHARPNVEPLNFRRLAGVKPAYTTRFGSRQIASDPRGYGLLTGDHVVPEAGDVALARVLKLGRHGGLPGPDGRWANLFDGDEIPVAYGGRYAPDRFEAEVSDNLGGTRCPAQSRA